MRRASAEGALGKLVVLLRARTHCRASGVSGAQSERRAGGRGPRSRSVCNGCGCGCGCGCACDLGGSVLPSRSGRHMTFGVSFFCPFRVALVLGGRACPARPGRTASAAWYPAPGPNAAQLPRPLFSRGRAGGGDGAVGELMCLWWANAVKVIISYLWPWRLRQAPATGSRRSGQSPPRQERAPRSAQARLRLEAEAGRGGSCWAPSCLLRSARQRVIDFEDLHLAVWSSGMILA